MNAVGTSTWLVISYYLYVIKFFLKIWPGETETLKIPVFDLPVPVLVSTSRPLFTPKKRLRDEAIAKCMEEHGKTWRPTRSGTALRIEYEDIVLGR